MRAAVMLLAALGAAAQSQPTSANCTEYWFPQVIDHFSFSSQATYQQRYFVYDGYWSHVNGCDAGADVGPIFFYTGNEGDVTLYVNATGLMWENAQTFGAQLVWAEHRYYGLSQPFGSQSDDPSNLQYLTHEQALADYAVLLNTMKVNMVERTIAAHPECKGVLFADDIPVITFGGSYGGMLSAWFRMKYPSVVDGAISASAPILLFPGYMANYPSDAYWQVVTNDASSAGGASDMCAANVRASWAFLFQQGTTPAGRAQLSTVFNTCTALNTEEDVYALAIYLLNAWDTLAMGDYPYPFNYLTGGGPNLPAFPVRAACSLIDAPGLTGWDLMAAANIAAGVFNNASGTLTCNPLPTDLTEAGIWGYQYCTEMLPEETFFTYNSFPNMFWNAPFNMTAINAHCYKEYGVLPRPTWILDSYGSAAEIASYASNIVFTNGALDPWSSGGVTTTLSPSLPAIVMADAAHHLDLFFSNPADPPGVTATRKFQMNTVSDWLATRKATRAALKARAAE